MFWLYMSGGKYIKVKKDMQLGLRSDIERATYWTDKNKALTWQKFMTKKYPSAELKQAILTIKNYE